MNIRAWNLHLIKASQYHQTKKVKNMIAKYGKDDYGINGNTPISWYHLLCVILYCDTNDLQKDFSSSFREKIQLKMFKMLKRDIKGIIILPKTWSKLLKCMESTAKVLTFTMNSDPNIHPEMDRFIADYHVL